MLPDAIDVPKIVAPILAWYEVNARDLPWRRPGVSPWAVLVSEIMLQQTPVNRVVGPWHRWLDRWPVPAALAADSPGEAIREWGRLGYPRRALRLHAAAVAMVDRFDGEVPSSYDELITLPGIGDYTAAAVVSFAFGGRRAVLDTNVRRVLARTVLGEQYPGGSPAAERRAAEQLLPRAKARAARWAVASMELGALVCTAASPSCASCPIRRQCAWQAAGRPAWSGAPRVGQRYEGTDRQCRGVVLAALRSAEGSVAADELTGLWHDAAQLDRAVASLIIDGLAERRGDELNLPSG